MRSLSSNLYKAGWVVMGEDARVIDTNKLIEQRLKKSAVTRPVHQDTWQQDSGEFTSGLEAENVDALFDQDSEGAVLKSASREELKALERELEAARGELERVRAEADKMLTEANVQIEEMRATALEEASNQGYQDGYSRGMNEVQVAKEQYINMQVQLKEEYNRQIEALEPEFVETLTEIYEHIFKVDLSTYHQLVVNLLIDAMQNTESARNYIVHVSKQDYPAVSEARNKILEETGTLSDGLEIIADMTLSASQCMIETEGGIYDCSLGTELEELKRKLKLISFRKSM